MTLSDRDIGRIAALLSAERLSRLNRSTKSRRIAIELHQQTLSLGSSMMTIIAIIEIALRNSVCQQLTRHFGKPDWLIDPPTGFVWKTPELAKLAAATDNAKRAVFAKLSPEQRAHLEHLAYSGNSAESPGSRRTSGNRHKLIVSSQSSLVSELTFFFWKRLFGPDYQHSLWRPALKTTFPDKTVSRSVVAAHLETIHVARNRLAHHEPLLHERFDDTMRSIDFITSHLGEPTSNPVSALALLLSPDLETVRDKAFQLHSRLSTFGAFRTDP